jgi:heat shock protein HslJ
MIFTGCSSSKKVSENRQESEEIKAEKPINTEKSKEKSVSSPAKINRIAVYFGDDSVTKWRLATLNSQKATDLYGVLPMMRFDNPWKQIYGTTGCNKFTAYYANLDDIFSISRISATGLKCNNGDESLFLDALKEINEIKEENSILYLLKNGQEVLTFEKY